MKLKKVEGMDSETEGVDSDNEEVDNKVLPPDRKGFSLSIPLTPPQYQLQ